MYFWKTNELESELRSSSLSQKERFKYLLAFVIITAVSVELSSYVPGPVSAGRLIESSVVILATILGTAYCYKINRKGDNADFIDRYVCLYLPVFIRVLVFFLITYSSYMILGFVLLGDSFDQFIESTNWIDIVFLIGFEIFFYWKVSASIRKIAIKNIIGEPVV